MVNINVDNSLANWLKTIGFDARVSSYFLSKRKLLEDQKRENYNSISNFVSRPYYSEVITWFLDTYNIHLYFKPNRLSVSDILYWSAHVVDISSMEELGLFVPRGKDTVIRKFSTLDEAIQISVMTTVSDIMFGYHVRNKVV